MAQGFTRNLNLQESNTPSSDRAIFNNLAFPSIAFDVALFDGNTKFKGQLLNNSSTSRVDFQVFNDPFDGYTVRVVGESKLAFTNNTILSLDGGVSYEYKVVNSNDQELFQLETISTSSIYDFNGLDTTNLSLTRNDTVFASNFNNLLPVRISTIGTDDGSGDLGSDTGLDEDAVATTVGTDPYTQIANIDVAISAFTEKRKRIPLTYKNNLFTKRVRLDGAIRIENNLNADTLRVKVGNNTQCGEFVVGQTYEIVTVGQADWTTVGWIANTGGTGASPAIGDKFVTTAKGASDSSSIAKAFQPPGLYIVNTATGLSTRAFSGNINPWEDETSVTIGAGAGVSALTISGANNGSLKTESDVAQPTNLILKPSDAAVDPEILITDTASSRSFVQGTSSESITEAQYTHKIPVLINGEQFYFLAKEGSTALQKTEYKVLLAT